MGRTRAKAIQKHRIKRCRTRIKRRPERKNENRISTGKIYGILNEIKGIISKEERRRQGKAIAPRPRFKRNREK